MNIISPEQIQEAIDALKQGAVIVFPTETTYGIGCDATNEEAIKGVIQLKGRDPKKGLIVLIESASSADSFIEMPEKGRRLVERHWPGPLNVIGIRKEGSIISTLASKNNMQAIRVSSNEIASALVKGLGRPLVATSANISGKDPAYSIEDIKEQFEQNDVKPDLIIDAGILPKNPPSTIIQTMGENIEVLRFGKIVL